MQQLLVYGRQAKMEYKFPKNFLWGAATSSHQIEGYVKNDWTEWEKKTAVRNSKKGVRPVLESLQKSASNPDNYLSDCMYSPESFKYWKQDVQVIKDMGLKAYRLSVEWSRIQPEKDTFSKEGIEYYKNVLKELKKNNIKVVLTCWHWTIPLWLVEENSLLSQNVVEYFTKYVEYLYENLSEYVDYWITINEPESFFFEYLHGSWPPGRKNIFLYMKVLYKILPSMHIESYKLIKGKDKDIPVSLAKSFVYVSEYNGFFLNKVVKDITNWFVNYSFTDKVKEYMDFVGVNFYFHNKVGILGIKNDNDKVSDMGWWLKPDKLYDLLKLIDNRYKLPMIITENGLADSRDEYKSWWIEESVKAMHKATEDGCNVFGYLHWSLLDNFEWDKGYWPKFGLVSIDPKTKERKIKQSGVFYSKIVKNNGII